MPLAPCPLCAASIPPLTSRGRTTSKARRGRLYEGAHARSPDRASAHPGRRSAMALHLLSFSIPPSHAPSGAVPGAPPATHATTHRHAASAEHQQIALAGMTLAAAAAPARHQYVLLALALVLICTGWRATLTRFSALGQPSTLRASRSPCSRRRRRSTTLGIAAASVSH